VSAGRRRRSSITSHGRTYSPFSFPPLPTTSLRTYLLTNNSLPARWAETKIVVSDSVIIEAPYGVENVKAPADKKVALAQIKRVVDGYWTKKATGKSGSSTPVGNGPPVRVPVPNVPRKGG
jgi:hypothetical protein